jgi:hypothetical protein
MSFTPKVVGDIITQKQAKKRRNTRKYSCISLEPRCDALDLNIGVALIQSTGEEAVWDAINPDRIAFDIEVA